MTHHKAVSRATGLGKRFGDLWALRDARSRRPRRHRPRPARPQRRRQDHRDPHPDHARAPTAGTATRRRASTSSRERRRRPRADRRRRPAGDRRRAADRPREPRAGRPALPPAARRRPAPRADELLERFDLADAADRLVRDLLRRHAPAARPGGEPDGRAAGPVPRRADDRPRPARAATSSGTLLRELVADGATLLLTTQYLEEADRLADEIVVLDHGRVAAAGTPAELKAPDRRRAHRGHRRRAAELEAAAARARPLRQRRAAVDNDGRARQRPASARARASSTSSGRSTRPASTPSTSTAARRRWTTCS